MPTASVVTLGCKVNQYESTAISEALEEAGFCLADAHEVCDVYVVNTCTVTMESDRKARQLIRRLITAAPDAHVIVTGCSAQAHAESIATIPGVSAVVGNRDKLSVVEVALSLLAAGKKPDAPLVSVPSLEGSRFEPMHITRFGRTRAYVKIEDGCESRCAYCAIPAARGPVRSKPREDILHEVADLTARGCREVVLTGIETGAWGRDLGGEHLEDLLAEIDNIPGIGRVRLGSLDPTVMTPAFVERVAALPSLAHHFHLSMQSGCSTTLARMRRRYNADMARAAMARVRAAMPDVMLTTDIIVGFPGETEEEFAASLAFAKEAGFLHIHVFPFSPREGTPAATMSGQVSDAVKHARVRAMSEVSEASAAHILDGYLAAAAPLDVLPETRGEGYFLGHTANFLEVRVEADGDAVPADGEIVTVLPVRREGEVLFCRPTSPILHN